MNHDRYSDDYIADILRDARVFAFVGASANTSRPSYFAMKYLLGKGYTIHPVNPGIAGQKLLGQQVYGSLADVPAPVDVIDIFRASEAALAVTREAIALKDKLGLKVLWMQLGDEPLPEDRVRPPLRRDRLGGRQLGADIERAPEARTQRGAEPQPRQTVVRCSDRSRTLTVILGLVPRTHLPWRSTSLLAMCIVRRAGVR
jgi:predicted CoA-binding protein